MNYVEGIGREFPRQPAKQRNELHFARVRLRHLFDHGSERAAMADADHLVFAAFEGLAQKACAFERQRLERQVALAEIGRHAAERQAEALGERVFQRDTLRHRALDENADHALAARARDQAVRLGALDIQPGCDFRLR